MEIDYAAAKRMIEPSGDTARIIPDPKPADKPKLYRCPSCRYVGTGIVADIPPTYPGQVDSRGVYCRKCLQDSYFRGGSTKMEEVK